MKIAITGATGFVGRALVRELSAEEHGLRCWCRTDSNLSPLEPYKNQIDWIHGDLGGDLSQFGELVDGCDAVVHSAFWRPGTGFRHAEGDLIEFARINILGSLRLMEAAKAARVKKFVFVSSGAVHEQIMDDRKLDEAHPLWPKTHYGAHKAAIEKFVHSFGLGEGFPICAIRPTGIYGVHEPIENSKWFSLVRSVVDGESVEVQGGGKEVHVDDVARGIVLLLKSGVAGEAYACYDRYVSKYEVATLAKEISGSSSQIIGEPTTPQHQIETQKIRRLGMTFGGTALLRQTIEDLVHAAQS